ncbi:MAG: hypothetical protein R2822_14705 [Spirosomataceae bacterium]
MKKGILIIAFFMLTNFVQANDNQRYMQAMGTTLADMGKATDLTSLQEVANKFERIANTETAEWLPNYYAALTYTLIAMRQKDGANIDKYLDKADSFIEKLSSQTINASDEVEVLKAQVAMMRIAVDGPGRWGQYGAIFEGAVGKAKTINPQNPRAYAMKAMMIYNTPVQFGGGPDKACPEIQTALQKFADFRPASPISPNWGLEQVEGMKKSCL